MPIYSYRCPECKYDLERIAKMDERDEQTCRNCESPLQRKIDRPGLVWAPTSSSSGVTRA